MRGLSSEVVKGGTSFGFGLRRDLFFSAKFWTRREGTPASRRNWCVVRDRRVGGRAAVVGRMRRMSQWVFWARRVVVEILVGRMIQRITLAVMRGWMRVEERAWRK